MYIGHLLLVHRFLSPIPVGIVVNCPIGAGLFSGGVCKVLCLTFRDVGAYEIGTDYPWGCDTEPIQG